MPERNRVTPLGDVVATPLRGAWTGNRGKIHEGHEIVRFHSGDLWLIWGQPVDRSVRAGTTSGARVAA